VHVVLLRPLGLGDFLTGVPAYRAVARAYPHARRTLAAPAALAPLLPLVGDALTELVATQPLAPLAPALRRADLAIDLHGRGPASHRVLLASEPRRLAAFAHAEIPESAGGAAWRADEHEIARWCRMLETAGIPADPRDLALLPPAPPADPAHRQAVIVHPGAASAARRWPADRFAAVARAARQRGDRVVVTGDAHEIALARTVAQAAALPDACVLAGRTSLAQLASVVAAAKLVVCGDTGIAHLATAFGTPSIVLFGPITPAAWGPPADRPQHTALWRGWHGDPHGTVLDPGLAEITVDDVLAAMQASVPPRVRAARG
jgi:ADP-heptose:LPS heptosyltransferase